jgi:hypothetical protein
VIFTIYEQQLINFPPPQLKLKPKLIAAFPHIDQSEMFTSTEKNAFYGAIFTTNYFN